MTLDAEDKRWLIKLAKMLLWAIAYIILDPSQFRSQYKNVEATLNRAFDTVEHD